MALPSNLLPLNASDISGSIQSLAGQIPTTGSVEIPEFSLLNQAIPDSLFLSGSYDEIRNRALSAGQTFVSLQTPTIPTLPAIPTTIPRLIPKLPTYGDIKNYVNTKIDRIKQERQRASIRALSEKLKQKEDPFTYRQQLEIKRDREAFTRLRDITNRG